MLAKKSTLDSDCSEVLTGLGELSQRSRGWDKGQGLGLGNKMDSRISWLVFVPGGPLPVLCREYPCQEPVRGLLQVVHTEQAHSFSEGTRGDFRGA